MPLADIPPADSFKGFGGLLKPRDVSKPTDSTPKSESKVEPQHVGKLGQPDRIVIQGQHAFSQEEIVQALMLDPGVFVASSSGSRLSHYLNQLQEKTLTGYEHAGYGRARVQLDLDDRHDLIVISVCEGERITPAI